MQSRDVDIVLRHDPIAREAVNLRRIVLCCPIGPHPPAGRGSLLA